MLTRDPAIYDLLYLHVTPSLLKGYYGGRFNETRTGFFAATYEPALPDEQELQVLFKKFHAYIILEPPPPNHQGTDRWMSAPPIPLNSRDFDGYAITFTGLLYEGEWYIMEDFHLFRNLDEAIVKQRLYQPDVFNSEYYRPAKDGWWRTGAVSKQEFADAPLLVAILREKEKERLHQAFRYWLYNGPLHRMVARLRARYNDQYDEIWGAFGDRFIPIFPAHKRYTLLATAAKGRHDAYATARYLFYDLAASELFEWTYFAPVTVREYLTDTLVEQLQTITYWNTTDYFYNTCTLDDDAFWEKYVLLKENGAYLYLQKLQV